MSKTTYITLGCGAVVAIAGAALVPTITRVHGAFAPSPLERFRSVRVPPVSGCDVLFICVDTVRADHVGLYGYDRPTTPRIDAFFEKGVVYETAYAATPSTGPSVVSMLTGLYPHRHGVRLLYQKISPERITIVDHLRRAGYQTAAVISNAVLADSACALGGRFEYYDDFVDEQEPFREDMFERRALRTTDAAISWLTEKRHSDSPHFLWVFYIDPHGPYRPPEDKPFDFSHDTPVRIDPERVPAYAREPDVLDGNEYVDRYDEEIAYTDREVGRLLDAYEELGLAERALIIFTSDHGESMMDHEHWFRHQLDVYEEMVRVPLAIRHPDLRPSRQRVAVTTVDLAPTILQMVSLPIPDGLDGVSLLPAPRPRSILCEGRSKRGGLWRGLILDQHKTMARHGMSNIVRESRAFDLRNDPLELHPLPVPQTNPALRVLEQLIASDPDPGGVPREYEKGELPSPNVAPIDDPRAFERLRSLGYVGDQ